MRVSSMPTFHFYEDGVKRHIISGAGEYQLRQLAERVANDAAAKNVKLSTEALRAFYDDHDAGKDIAPISAKCASLAKSKDCVGGAARELAKKLKQKFGSAPQSQSASTKREPPKPKPKRTSRSLDQASTMNLLAELAKRSDDDDLAFAATEAAETARRELEEEDEDEDEEDDEGALPLYRAARAICRARRDRGRGSRWAERGGLRGARWFSTCCDRAVGRGAITRQGRDGGELSRSRGRHAVRRTAAPPQRLVKLLAYASRRRGGCAECVQALHASRRRVDGRAARRTGPRPQDAGARGGLRRGVLPAQGLEHRPVAEALPRGRRRRRTSPPIH